MKIHCKNAPIKSMEQKVFVEMQIGELVSLVCGYGGNTRYRVTDEFEKFVKIGFIDELDKFNAGHKTYRPMHNALADLGVFKEHK